MANLKQMRASVIAAVTEARPTIEFPVPDKLVDHIIFGSANTVLAEKWRRQRGVVSVESWMLTRFECVPPALSTPKCLAPSCAAEYGIELPFLVLSLSDDAGIRATIAESGIRINRVAPGLVALNQHGRYPATYEHPCFTRIGQHLYFWGGNRQFDKLNITLEAAVIGITGATAYIDPYDTDIVVPIPSDIVRPAEDLAIARIMNMLDGKVDLVEDGIPIEKTNVG